MFISEIFLIGLKLQHQHCQCVIIWLINISSITEIVQTHACV
jgi:hypothetical protein